MLPNTPPFIIGGVSSFFICDPSVAGSIYGNSFSESITKWWELLKKLLVSVPLNINWHLNLVAKRCSLKGTFPRLVKPHFQKEKREKWQHWWLGMITLSVKAIKVKERKWTDRRTKSLVSFWLLQYLSQPTNQSFASGSMSEAVRTDSARETVGSSYFSASRPRRVWKLILELGTARLPLWISTSVCWYIVLF